ncbi:MAG: lipocalin-like domain-containing protein [Xanthobacteraceae bacterium]
MTGRGLWGARMAMRAASTASGPPVPVPPSDYKIHLPADQYRHVGAPTEWWWHIGTLKAGDRIFGFEINAAGYPDYNPLMKYAFTQVMLSDVAKAKHYQKTTGYLPPNVDFDTWAQSDPSKPWHVGLGRPADGAYVAMNAPQADPTKNMTVQAHMADEVTKTKIDFDLMLSQQGPPFMVFGTGVKLNPDKSGPPLKMNNYYYSLTRVQASGTIKIGAESFDVTGMTWMDHEYGNFGSPSDPVKWILQNAQLDNGWHLMNFVSFGKDKPPALGDPTPSNVTLQGPNGDMYYFDADSHQAVMTPTGKTWTSPTTGITYFLEYLVEILPFKATLTVKTLMDDQEFPVDDGKGGAKGGVYEGVAVASGTFQGQQVSGTAWNEQLL